MNKENPRARKIAAILLRSVRGARGDSSWSAIGQPSGTQATFQCAMARAERAGWKHAERVLRDHALKHWCKHVGN